MGEKKKKQFKSQSQPTLFFSLYCWPWHSAIQNKTEEQKKCSMFVHNLAVWSPQRIPCTCQSKHSNPKNNKGTKVERVKEIADKIINKSNR